MRGVQDVGKEPLTPRPRSLHGQQPQLGFVREKKQKKLGERAGECSRSVVAVGGEQTAGGPFSTVSP